ncbi:MAG: hypothetical protein AAGC55_19065, partial [Myxococcota bacterium]
MPGHMGLHNSDSFAKLRQLAHSFDRIRSLTRADLTPLLDLASALGSTVIPLCIRELGKGERTVDEAELAALISADAWDNRAAAQRDGDRVRWACLILAHLGADSPQLGARICSALQARAGRTGAQECNARALLAYLGHSAPDDASGSEPDAEPSAERTAASLRLVGAGATACHDSLDELVEQLTTAARVAA